MTANSNSVRIRCRAFTGQPIQRHRIWIDRDGTVRVWDSVAGYWTTCHSLSRAAVARARKLLGS